MSEKNLVNRISDLEGDMKAISTDVENLEKRLEKIEQSCVRTHERVSASFEKLDTRIDLVVKNEMHKLEEKVNGILANKRFERTGLSRSDWVKIITTCIITAGSIIVAFMQFGIK